MRLTASHQAILLAFAGVVAASSVAHAAAPAPRYIVTFKQDQESLSKAASVRAYGEVKRELAEHGSVAMELSASALKSVQNHPSVASVEVDAPRYPLSNELAAAGQVVPYGIKMVQADLLSDANAGNRKVCIIDSGYDLSHEDLAANNVTGDDDPLGTGKWSVPGGPHGTHVAGTIAGINNAVGVVGVLPNKKVKLHIVKVFSEGGWAYSSDLVAATDKCKAAGSNIISMSLGGAAYSSAEKKAFDKLLSAGVLSIAAAGNDGNSTMSYPASYPAVMSVAALNDKKEWADFSQYNSAVAIAAPGVDVLSSVTMGEGRDATLTVDGAAVTASVFTGSPVKTASAALADCGIADSVCKDVSGKVCLIQRGTVSFAVKVKNCQSGGGIGAIVYNNAAGMLNGTLGTEVVSIPALGVSDTDGAALKAKLGKTANAAVVATNYSKMNGTSMATPHVSAVAALVWSYFPTCTASNVRKALQSTSED